MTGQIHQINTSRGGVPKLPVTSAEVGVEGITTDRQRDRRYHGGPERALCIYALERIEELRTEGHPIAPGTAGENLTVVGIDPALLVPGARLELGRAVVAEIASYCAPCRNIAGSFADGDFMRISQKTNPGWSRVYARVLATGMIATGDEVRLVPAPAPDQQSLELS